MIDLRLRLFIPSRAVAVPMGPVTTGFDGDNRGFSFDGGTSRAEIWVDVDHSPVAQKIISVEKIKSFGQTARYSMDKIADVPGKPFWWKTVRQLPFLNVEIAPDATDVAQVTPDTLSVHGQASSQDVFGLSPSVVVTLHVNGTNPLEPLAPPFDLDLAVTLSRTGLPAFSYGISGSHDAFPAYELYLNRRLVYGHDPVAFGSSPLSLFEHGGVRVDVPTSLFI
jgi:Protein of unknown function (DUF3238)